jgi:hypothetical protein
MSLNTTIQDEDTCCICMESKSNLALNCTHSFCENCIKEWQISSNTCPICRSITEDDDCFVLADKPDYFHIQEEISKSLFQITENNSKNSKSNNKRPLLTENIINNSVLMIHSDSEDSD